MKMMRAGTDKAKLFEFIDAIGKTAQGPGRVYLVGGSTALLLGIREQTVDIDIKLDPEPKAIFENIAILKERLNVNVELASPDQFLPVLRCWRERSEFIAKSGPVEFYHYDFYAQALAKILRGHQKDIGDANALATLGKIDLGKLLSLFLEIKPDLVRYPAIDAMDFQLRVEEFVKKATPGHE